MKRKRMNLGWDASSEIIRHPALPVAGSRLFDQLRSVLSHSFADQTLTLEQLAFGLRLPLSTVHDWFRVAPLAQVQALLCLLEQMPEPVWRKIISATLREFPSLRHPRLAHDHECARLLHAILHEPAGITVIEGGSEDDRSFVFTALGHSITQVDPFHRSPAGLDVHEPMKFVPIPGVAYFKHTLARRRLAELLVAEWQEVVSGNSPWLLLNGVWSAVPELRPAIVATAAKRHAVLAEQHSPSLAKALRSLNGSTRVLEVLKDKGNPSILRLRDQSLY